MKKRFLQKTERERTETASKGNVTVEELKASGLSPKRNL